jgi:WD40 repeat protein
VNVSANGKRFASTNPSDRMYSVVDLDSGTLRRWRYERNDSEGAICLSPDGKTVFAGTHGGIVHVWEAETGKKICDFDHVKPVRMLRCSSDGRRLMSGSGTSLRTWDLTTRLFLNEYFVDLAAFDTSARLLATACSEYDYLRLANVDTGKEIRAIYARGHKVSSVALSPDGKWLVSGGGDKTIRMWDVESGKEIRRYVGHDSVVQRLAYAPNGHTFASQGRDGIVLIWDATPRPAE